MCTSPEIWERREPALDAVVLGVGNSGTIKGLSRFFRQAVPDLLLVLCGLKTMARAFHAEGPSRISAFTPLLLLLRDDAFYLPQYLMVTATSGRAAGAAHPQRKDGHPAGAG